MSTRGGYGFVVDGKEIIVYTGNGADLTSLGDILTDWLKKVSFQNVKSQIENLQEVNRDDYVSAEDIALVAGKTGVTPESRYRNEITTWNDLLYFGQCSPEFLLESGHYIDGSWIINSVDLEYFYMIDFDKNRLEIYHGYSHQGEIQGRFGNGIVLTGKERGEHPPTLLAMYPLDNLPDNLNWLEENQYELKYSPFNRSPQICDTSGDPTFIHPDSY